MTIVVWGIDHGMCLPYSGQGFRKEFSSSAESDEYIKQQCNKVPRKEIDKYAMYITDEYISLDRVLHHHSWKDTNYKYRDIDAKIHEVNIPEIKNQIDIAYQAHMRKQSNKKMMIDEEMRNMSGSERERQKKLFSDADRASQFIDRGNK